MLCVCVCVYTTVSADTGPYGRPSQKRKTLIVVFVVLVLPFVRFLFCLLVFVQIGNVVAALSPPSGEALLLSSAVGAAQGAD